MSKKKRSPKTYCTDKFLNDLYEKLVTDLEPMNPNWFTRRSYSGPGYNYWKPYDFKVMSQLQHFFKRVLRYQDPTFEELSLKGRCDFIATQASIGKIQRNVITDRVFQKAAEICKSIVGDFSYEKLRPRCSFGKKAALGLPYSNSYLDVRVDSLTGTAGQFAVFKDVLAHDIHLNRAVRRSFNNIESSVRTISVTAVPKTFKTVRMIAPDTSIGGFLSRGVGAMLRTGLEENTHIKLNCAQGIHQELARKSSLTGYHATVDMSKASDSFVKEHIDRTMPDSWHEILAILRTDSYSFSGEKECRKLNSYMLMGSGHTFPLQTILFYSYCKAVLSLMGSEASVFVYGDDIIFPSDLAYYVIVTLEMLGFTINANKSFVDGPFRESCGGDFHTGVDVRPFMPEHACGLYQKHEYTEFLHKIYNGFLKRWTYEELPTTLNFILLELIRVQGDLCPIPIDYPDTYGVVLIPPMFKDFTKKPQYIDFMWYYLCLIRTPKRRMVRSQRPYYWNWLHRDHKISDPYEDISTEPSINKGGSEARKGSYRMSWKRLPHMEPKD